MNPSELMNFVKENFSEGDTMPAIQKDITYTFVGIHKYRGRGYEKHVGKDVFVLDTHTSSIKTTDIFFEVLSPLVIASTRGYKLNTTNFLDIVRKRGWYDDNTKHREFPGLTTNESYYLSVVSAICQKLSLYHVNSPKAADINEAPESLRSKIEVNRIIRDTALARDLKVMHDFSCQICGQSIDLSNGKLYAEAHHLKPLGSPHNGPDVAGNIVVLCPNHHAQCDYGAIKLSASGLHSHADHIIDEKYIAYHNKEILEL
jgi:hypothetical protein